MPLFRPEIPRPQHCAPVLSWAGPAAGHRAAVIPGPLLSAGSVAVASAGTGLCAIPWLPRIQRLLLPTLSPSVLFSVAGDLVPTHKKFPHTEAVWLDPAIMRLSQSSGTDFWNIPN